MRTATAIAMLLPLPLLALAADEPGEEPDADGAVWNFPANTVNTTASRAQVLLVPVADPDGVAMFDTNDGTYLGNFIVDDPTGTEYDLYSPANAVQHEDYVFVSSSYNNVVYIFDNEGSFFDIAAQTQLYLPRGIDFRNDTLFVTCHDNYVAMYSGPDVFAGYFIWDAISPGDILFTDEVTSGSALVSNKLGYSDDVRHYDADGTLMGGLLRVSTPAQVQIDAGNPGFYLVVSFYENTITRFQIDGTIESTIPFTRGSGVYRLGNGNLLATNSVGVHEIDPSTGQVLQTEYNGSGRFIELANVTITGNAEEAFGPVQLSGVSIYPSPFSETLSIGVTLPAPAEVSVTVYSLEGRVAGQLEPEVLSGGSHVLQWNAGGLENGLYIVRVAAPGGSYTRKVQLLN